MADFVLDLNNLIKGDGAKMTLNEIITSLEKLNSVYNVMISQAQGKAEEFAKGLETISKAADQLEESFKHLDISAKKDQDSLSKGAQELEMMVKQSDEYNVALANTKKQIDSLTTSQESLQESQEKVNKQQEAGVGSLTELRQQLALATKDYTNMSAAEREVSGPATLTRISDLSKQIKEQDTALKNAKKGIDNAKGSYNDLAAQVRKAKEDLKAMEGGIGSETAEFKELQKFVADGTDKLKEFDAAINDDKRNVGNYKSAVEGLGTIGFGGLITQVNNTGKELLKLSKNPWFLLIAGIIAIIKTATEAVSTFFTTTGQGEDILEREKAVWDAFFLTIRKGFASVGEDIYNFFGGLKGIISNVLSSFGPQFATLNAMFIQSANVLETIAIKADQLGDEIINNIVIRAERELNINKLLEASKNTLLYTDEQRLDFLKQASATRETQAKREIELAQQEFRLLAQRINFEQGANELTDEQKKKIAEAAAKIIDLESQYFQEQKKNTAQIAALTQEIEKRKREAAERELDTRREISKFILQDEIDTQKKIIDTEQSTLAERTKAILTSNEARLQILEQDKQHELDIVQRAAEERIRAEGKLVTDQLLANDKALQNQRTLIADKYVKLVEDSNEATKKAVEDNFWKVLQRDAAIATAQIDQALNEQLLALNDTLNLGQISLEEYEREKKSIQVNGQRVALMSQLDFLKKELAQVEDNSQKKAEILDKISKVELDLSQIGTNQKIDDLKKLEAAQKQLAANVQQIQQEAFNLAATLVDASVERNINALNKQLDAESQHKDQRLKIVGDDKQAQALIEQDFANKQKQINLEIAAEKRKQAVFEKSLNAAQIISNTATAIMKTLAEGGFLALPLSVTIGAIGALQLARVLATPIPAFYAGTEYSPEGKAWVGDRYGRELAVDPQGNITMYNRPTMANLKEGTRIFSNKQTEQIADLIDIEKNIQGNNRDAMILGDHRALVGMSNEEVVVGLKNMKEEVVDAIKSQPQDYYDEAGYRRYERIRNAKVQRLDDKFRFKK